MLIKRVILCISWADGSHNMVLRIMILIWFSGWTMMIILWFSRWMIMILIIWSSRWMILITMFSGANGSDHGGGETLSGEAGRAQDGRGPGSHHHDHYHCDKIKYNQAAANLYFPGTTSICILQAQQVFVEACIRHRKVFHLYFSGPTSGWHPPPARSLPTSGVVPCKTTRPAQGERRPPTASEVWLKLTPPLLAKKIQNILTNCTLVVFSSPIDNPRLHNRTAFTIPQ